MSGTMRGEIDSLPLRVVGIAWGLFETMGFLWTYSTAVELATAIYWGMPALALMAGALLPRRILQIRVVKICVLIILAAGMARRLHTVAQELFFTSPPYFLAALLQAITLCLLGFMMYRTARSRLANQKAQ